MSAKTIFNVFCILAAGAIGGYIYRTSQPKPSVPDDALIYTDDAVSMQDGKLLVDPTAQPIESDPETPPPDEKWSSEFKLTERSGEEISSDDLLGSPYLVSFFFTTCPSICVQQNQKLAELQKEFAGQNVKFVAISVDPETDTPQRLREYAARFGADPDQWLFMTGNLDYIKHVGETIFDQPVDKKFHTERFVLVDPEGNIEGFYSWPNRRHMAKLRDRIQSMLTEST